MKLKLINAIAIVLFTACVILPTASAYPEKPVVVAGLFKKIKKEITRSKERVEKQVHRSSKDIRNLPKRTEKEIKKTKKRFDKELKRTQKKSEKLLGTSLRWTGRVIQRVNKKAVKFTKDVGDSVIEIDKKFAGLSADLVDLVTPEGAWSIKIPGVATIKSHKSVGERLRQYSKEFSDGLSKVYNFSHKGFNVIGKLGIAIENLGYYFALSAKGFPPAMLNPVVNVKNPDFSVALSRHYINSFLENLKKHPILYGKPGSNEYFQIGKAGVILDMPKNSIFLKIKSVTIGVEALKGKLGGGIKVKEAILQLCPVISREGRRYNLKIYMRLIYLDIKNNPKRLDCMAAFVLQDKLLNKSLFSEDITNYIAPAMKSSMKINEKKAQDINFLFQAERASVTVEGDSISIKSRYDIGERK